MKKKTILSVAALLCAGSMMAVPAKRGALSAKQPDGTTVTFYLQGDEHHHVYLTADGYRIAQDGQGTFRYVYHNADGQPTMLGAPMVHDQRSKSELDFIRENNIAIYQKDDAASAMRKTAVAGAADDKGNDHGNFKIGSFPTVGKGKCPVLLVEFADITFTLDQDFHHRMLNEEGFADDGATGSARDYFVAQSAGLFEPQFDVIGPVRLTRTSSYYGNDDYMQGTDVHVGEMIKDACQKASDDRLVDFSQYDGDGDGKVDMVYVIFAGYGQNAGAPSNTIWPHKYQLSSFSINLTIDGKTIDTYACSAELDGNSGTSSAGIGTVCHEFGHVLGLADHYNTDDATDYQFGSYDIMDYGAYNNNCHTPPAYNAFERWTLGWLTPTAISEPEDLMQLLPVADSNEAYLLSTRNPNEFYLLENRQQEGWDAHIKGSGMMITHVDFEPGAWNRNVVNNDTKHPRATMVAADNEKTYDVLKGSDTEKYDLYPMKKSPFSKNDCFTAESTPAATPYTGETFVKWVTDIKNEDGVVSFNFMPNCLKTPKALSANEITDKSFLASWAPVDKATAYDLAIYRLRYVSELGVALQQGFNDMPAGWESENATIDNGWCQVGKTGTSGHLTTPELDLHRYDGKFAVAVTVKSADGKQPVFTVSANGQQGKTRLTSAARTYVFRFNGGFSKTPVTFEVNKERAFIDSIVVVRGDQEVEFDNMKEVAVTGDIEFVEGEVEDNNFYHAENHEVKDVTDTQYRFENLDPQACYAFTVKAKNDEATSMVSEEYQVFTEETSGIGRPNVADNGEHGTELYYTLDGRRYNGLPQRGLYIVKKGTAAKKMTK